VENQRAYAIIGAGAARVVCCSQHTLCKEGRESSGVDKTSQSPAQSQSIRVVGRCNTTPAHVSMYPATWLRAIRRGKPLLR